MMKISKPILLIHSIIEAIMGVILILNPVFIMNNGNTDPSHLAVAKIYGIGAFTIGILSYQVWKKFGYSSFDKMAVLILMTFHLMIGLQMYSFYSIKLVPNPGGAVVHIILAIAFAIAYIKEKTIFE